MIAMELAYFLMFFSCHFPTWRRSQGPHAMLLYHPDTLENMCVLDFTLTKTSMYRKPACYMSGIVLSISEHIIAQPHKPCVFVFCGRCVNKWPQTGWLNSSGSSSLLVLEDRRTKSLLLSWNQGVRQVALPVGIPFLASSSRRWLSASPCLGLYYSNLSLCLLGHTAFSSSIYDQISLCLPLTNILGIASGAHPDNPG